MTPAIRFLEKQGIPHQVLQYDHQEKGAAFAAQAIGISLKKTIKTLVTDLVPGGCCLVLMPGSKTISFKKLAKAKKAKRAAMADTQTAERLSGYLVGGISPFGFKTRLPVLMESGLLELQEVAINGGRRGVMLLMCPSDIATVLNAETAEL